MGRVWGLGCRVYVCLASFAYCPSSPSPFLHHPLPLNPFPLPSHARASTLFHQRMLFHRSAHPARKVEHAPPPRAGEATSLRGGRTHHVAEPRSFLPERVDGEGLEAKRRDRVVCVAQQRQSGLATPSWEAPPPPRALRAGRTYLVAEPCPFLPEKVQGSGFQGLSV